MLYLETRMMAQAEILLLGKAVFHTNFSIILRLPKFLFSGEGQPVSHSTRFLVLVGVLCCSSSSRTYCSSSSDSTAVAVRTTVAVVAPHKCRASRCFEHEGSGWTYRATGSPIPLSSPPQSYYRTIIYSVKRSEREVNRLGGEKVF